MALHTSARNQLAGTVSAIKLGDIMAQIEIRVGENQLVSVITRTAVEELGLKEGDEVLAIIKSTEVMVAKPDEGRSGPDL